MISIYKKLYLDAEINYVRDIVIKNARIKDVMSNLKDNSKLKLFLHEFPLDQCDIMDLQMFPLITFVLFSFPMTAL
jgi:hypothetical protein